MDNSLQLEVEILREALQSIAKSYPETDEGEMLADLAKDALAASLARCPSLPST